MTPLAIGYSIEDLALVRQLEQALEGSIRWEHFAAGRENEGPLLAPEIGASNCASVLVISDDFLTNPNCMLGAQTMLQDDQGVLLVVVGTDLDSRAAQMRYISHWQDRYIELRRGAEAFDETGKENFSRYLSKIRETSIGIPEVIERLHLRGSVTPQMLKQLDYAPLLALAGRTAAAAAQPTWQGPPRAKSPP